MDARTEKISHFLTRDYVQGKPMELRLSNMVAAKGAFSRLLGIHAVFANKLFSNQRCSENLARPKRNGQDGEHSTLPTGPITIFIDQI